MLVLRLYTFTLKGVESSFKVHSPSHRTTLTLSRLHMRQTGVRLVIFNINNSSLNILLYHKMQYVTHTHTQIHTASAFCIAALFTYVFVIM